jgi:HEAT repeat protein
LRRAFLFLLFCGLAGGGTYAFFRFRPVLWPPSPGDIAYLPDRCDLVTSVNVLACLSSQTHQKLKDAGAGLEHGEEAVFQRLTGLAPGDVQRLTFARAFTEEGEWVLVLHTAKIVSASDLRAEGEPEPKESRVGKHTLYERAENAFFLPDRRTVVLGRAGTLQRVIQRNAPAPLPPGLQAAVPPGDDSSRGLRVALKVDILPRSDVRFAGADFSPLTEALRQSGETVLLESPSGTPLDFEVTVRCQDEESAHSAAEGLNKAIGQLSKSLPDELSKALEQVHFEAAATRVQAKLPLRAALLVEPLRALKWERPDYAIEALCDGPDARRKEAAARLAKDPARSVPLLIQALARKDPRVQAAAAGVLGGMGPDAAPAAKALARVLLAPQPELRRAAAEALARIGPGARDDALAPLLQCQADADEGVSQAARQALAKLGPPTAADVNRLLAMARDTTLDARARATALGALTGIDADMPTLLPTLTQSLNDTDKQVRKLAVTALGKLAGKQRAAVLPLLVKGLGDTQEEVRAAAAAAVRGLGAITGPEAAALAETFKTAPEPSVRLAVVQALTRADPDGRKAAAPTFLEGLKDDDPSVRAACARALDGAGPPDPAHLSALVRELGRPSTPPEMKRYVLQALSKLGPRVRSEKFYDLGRTLLALLDDPDLGEPAFQALQAVGPPGDAEAPTLARLLQDRKVPSRVRAYAAGVLGPMAADSPVAAAALFEALQDEDRGVRRGAAEGLAHSRLKTPETTRALAKALQDVDREVRLQATTALAALPPEARPLPHLLTAFGDDDEDVVRRAAGGLARLDRPSPEDLAVLGEALGSKRLRVRLYAATTLADLGPGAKPALEPLTRAVKDPDPAVRTLALAALRGLEAEAFPAAPALTAALEDSDPGVRVEAAATLVRMREGAKAVVPVLLRAARDKEHPAHELAQESLRRLGGWARPAVPLLLEGLRKEETRPLAVQALVGIGKEAADLLGEALRDKDPDVRVALLEALGKIGPDARAALLAVNARASRDPYPEVREAARKASALIQTPK